MIVAGGYIVTGLYLVIIRSRYGLFPYQIFKSPDVLLRSPQAGPGRRYLILIHRRTRHQRLHRIIQYDQLAPCIFNRRFSLLDPGPVFPVIQYYQGVALMNNLIFFEKDLLDITGSPRGDRIDISLYLGIVCFFIFGGDDEKIDKINDPGYEYPQRNKGGDDLSRMGLFWVL